jgi:hypothetical protein
MFNSVPVERIEVSSHASHYYKFGRLARHYMQRVCRLARLAPRDLALAGWAFFRSKHIDLCRMQRCSSIALRSVARLAECAGRVARASYAFGGNEYAQGGLTPTPWYSYDDDLYWLDTTHALLPVWPRAALDNVRAPVGVFSPDCAYTNCADKRDIFRGAALYFWGQKRDEHSTACSTRELNAVFLLDKRSKQLTSTGLTLSLEDGMDYA